MGGGPIVRSDYKTREGDDTRESDRRVTYIPKGYKCGYPAARRRRGTFQAG
jgi:hypothetical protein